MRRQNEAMDEQMAGSVRRHDLDTPSGHSATRIRPAHASTAIHGGVEISQMSTPDVPLLGASALERVSVPAVRRPRRRPLVARRAWTAVRLLTDLGSALVAVALAVVASGSTWHDVLAYPSLLASRSGLW
jgi:hypothetical protein